VIEKNILLGKRTIEAPTINKHLAALGKFSTWLLANDYIAEPVMTGMYLDENRRERKRLPFTSDQLTELFRSPLYTGFQSDGKEHQPGNLTTRGWRFWLPLVGLFTGARLGEIAQLHTADVRQIHGTWVIHVTTEGGDKSTKTAGSMRVIPVHSELIRLGFLDYHAKIKARHEKRLFPEIEPDARGFLSGRPSEFYRDYLRRIGIKTKQDRTINFHSLRHGFADALRRAGYRDEEFGFLLGHTKASTTGRYGIVAQGVLEQRVAMIEGVGFPGVDLKHLYVTGL
jgi:integrase